MAHRWRERKAGREPYPCMDVFRLEGLTICSSCGVKEAGHLAMQFHATRVGCDLCASCTELLQFAIQELRGLNKMTEHTITIDGHRYRFEMHPHTHGPKVTVEPDTAPAFVVEEPHALDKARDIMRFLFDRRATE